MPSCVWRQKTSHAVQSSATSGVPWIPEREIGDTATSRAQSRPAQAACGSAGEPMPQIAATASCSRGLTWPATVLRWGLSIACIEATGLMALTMMVYSSSDRTITLQGSMAPTLGSIFIASSAIIGLQAPRMR